MTTTKKSMLPLPFVRMTLIRRTGSDWRYAVTQWQTSHLCLIMEMREEWIAYLLIQSLPGVLRHQAKCTEHCPRKIIEIRITEVGVAWSLLACWIIRTYTVTRQSKTEEQHLKTLVVNTNTEEIHSSRDEHFTRPFRLVQNSTRREFPVYE